MYKSLIRMLLTVSLVLLMSLSCTSGGGSDNNEPNYEPGDYENNSSGDNDFSDGDNDNGIEPDCAEVCYAYCNLSKDCLSTFDQQQYYLCRESCRGIASAGEWNQLISCAHNNNGNCSAFDKCLAADGLADWLCDPGEDTGTDDDAASDGDIEGNVNSTCQTESDCEGQTHCDTETNLCRPACDPYYPQCADDESCRILTEGELAGAGIGICVAIWSGAGEGAICIENSDCAPGLLCGYTAQCERICDPDSEDDNVCDYRVNCTAHAEYGVGTCAFCMGDEQCGALVCENGYCVEEWECHQSQDCGVSGQGCFHGQCENGCTSNGECPPGGACQTDSAYCYGDVCAEDCNAEGKCCNRHECGPCCAEECAIGETCAYDPRCYPDLFCCVEPVDCREKPEGYCGAYPCSLDNGACGGACPVTCNWGYGCGLWSEYDCKPLLPEPCSMVGMNCEEEFACMMCNGETLGESGQCVATEDCPISKLDEGMSCYIDPFFSLECQAGQTCCLGKDGYYTCCSQEKCVNGLGCIKPGDIPSAPYICPECDRLSGDWVLESEEGDCPDIWQKLVLKRDESYDCFFVLYHDSAIWENRLVDLMNCDSQALIFDETNGDYSECVLFLDGLNDSLKYHCKGSGGSCYVNYKKQ